MFTEKITPLLDPSVCLVAAIARSNGCFGMTTIGFWLSQETAGGNKLGGRLARVVGVLKQFLQ